MSRFACLELQSFLSKRLKRETERTKTDSSLNVTVRFITFYSFAEAPKCFHWWGAGGNLLPLDTQEIRHRKTNDHCLGQRAASAEGFEISAADQRKLKRCFTWQKRDFYSEVTRGAVALKSERGFILNPEEEMSQTSGETKWQKWRFHLRNTNRTRSCGVFILKIWPEPVLHRSDGWRRRSESRHVSEGRC